MYVIREAQKHHRRVEMHIYRKVWQLVRLSMFRVEENVENSLSYSLKKTTIKIWRVHGALIRDYCKSFHQQFEHLRLRYQITALSKYAAGILD